MQAFLTFSFDAIALVGLTGIILHAICNHHKIWMQTYCPPIKPYELEQEKPQIKSIILSPPLPTTPEIEPKDFSKMTVKELVEICKENKERYGGYTTQQKKGKKAFVDWMNQR